MGDTSETSRIFDVLSKNSIVSNASSNVSSMYENLSNNSLLFFGLLAVIIITIIIAALLYTYIGWQLFSKVQNNIDGTKVPVVGTELTKIIADIDDTGNGNRRSYSFWIYINDMNKYRGQFKNVLGISPNGTNFINSQASPHIFLDDKNNSLYVRFYKKADINITSTNCTSLANDDNLAEYIRQGIEIKYVPLQRWVHIVIVCNADSFRTSLYAYVDGDLIKTISSGEQFSLSKNNTITKTADLSDIELNGKGFLYIGSNPNSYCSGPGFSGLISNFSAYNYELNTKDIYAIYNKGPITGLLAALGLSNYGVRSPIYKL